MSKRMSSEIPPSLYSSVAKKILTESVNAKKGDSITIESWNTGLEFARYFALEARRMGCLPIVLFEDEVAYVNGVKSSPPDTLGQLGKHEIALLSNTDVYVFIPGPPIGVYSKSLTLELRTKSTAYNASWYEVAERAKIRGVRLSFGYIDENYSKLLGKPVVEIIKHQLYSALVDFQEIGSIGREISGGLSDDVEATLETGKTNKLTFRLKGDTTLEDGILAETDIAAGHNMAYIPPGLISKQIDPSSASGKVLISPSVTRLGIVHESTLEFKGGKLIGFESKSAQARKMLGQLVQSTPEDSRSLKQVTIGLNPRIRQGYGQDRFVRGNIGIAGFGFSCVVQGANLAIPGSAIVKNGRPA